MPSVEWHGAREMVRDLKRMREKALPYGIRNALNTSAFEAQKIWRVEIRRTFTVRNHFTERSILVERASGTDLAAMEARVGSTAPYMGKQETGGTVRGGGSHKPIPGPVAAGLAPGAKRTRLVRARFYLGAINVAHPALHGSRQQRNAIAIAVAQRAGQKLVLLERPKGGKGLFILGGRRGRVTTRLLWDMSRGSVHVPAAPTLERSLAMLRPKLEHIHMASILQQLQRFNVPGY